jgi:hypothetical protein
MDAKIVSVAAVHYYALIKYILITVRNQSQHGNHLSQNLFNIWYGMFSILHLVWNVVQHYMSLCGRDRFLDAGIVIKK